MQSSVNYVGAFLDYLSLALLHQFWTPEPGNERKVKKTLSLELT